MASTYAPFLHDNVIEGMDVTTPAHLIGHKWTRQHNIRITPTLEQVQHKVQDRIVGPGADVIHMVSIPGREPGTGIVLVFTSDGVYTLDDYIVYDGLYSEFGQFHRYSSILYNGACYYINELNLLRRNDGTFDTEVVNAPAGRYLANWYDHMVVGRPSIDETTYPNRVMWSHLYDFNTWTPAASNEADHYDFVEWQQQDYPYVGITGLAKLRGTLWVYTPTAIIPMEYVGLPKIVHVDDRRVLTRIGNTLPYTLVALDNVHFFYDGIERNFFAFDGQTVTPIGEPIRAHLFDDLNPEYSIQSKMYAYVDVDEREIWWVYPSVNTVDNKYDKAVVFNYRYRRWYTASVENVNCFCAGVTPLAGVTALGNGGVGELSGNIAGLGRGTTVPKMYGSDSGKILRNATADDANATLLTQEDPYLESADFHYGDIRTVKENDGMILNAYWYYDPINSYNTNALIEVYSHGRNFLSEPITWAASDKKGDWTPRLQDGKLGYTGGSETGRVLRYKFIGKNVRGMQFSAWSDLVRARGAEK